VHYNITTYLLTYLLTYESPRWRFELSECFLLPACVNLLRRVQMCMSDVNVVDSEVDKSVIELVDHIWTEATGHLDEILSVPASSITSDQVNCCPSCNNIT